MNAKTNNVVGDWQAPSALEVEADVERERGRRRFRPAHVQELAERIAALPPRVLPGRGDRMRPPRFYPTLTPEEKEMVVMALRQMSEGY